MATFTEFDPFSREFFDDPYDLYAWLRDEQPVYHNERLGFWALSRFADVVTAHRDPVTFSSAYGLTLDDLSRRRPTEQVSMITTDPPDHQRFRSLVSRSFTPRSIERLEPIARGVISKYLDELMDRDEFDVVEEFSAPFPVEVICAVLGVPEQDRQPIRHRTDLTLHREEGKPGQTDEGMQAAIENFLYWQQFIADKRVHPGNDMMSDLIAAEVSDGQGGTTSLTDIELAGIASLLAAAGSETVTKAVANAVVLFHRHPGEWQKVLDDEGKVPNAVEEVLRYMPPSQYQGRFTLEDAHFEGGTIPAGEPTFLITGAAMRDPREFDEPDRFDVDRTIRLQVALGHGIHACLGAYLARLETRISLQEFRRRWPRFTVDESRCGRVHMSNVAGYSNVPVRVGG